MKFLKFNLLIVVLLIIVIFSGALFILDQRESALIIQFGKVVKQEMQPGLKFKIPLIQEVKYFDKRIQNLTFDLSEMIAVDQKTMKLDAYAKYKITNPKRFYEAVTNDENFKSKIWPIIDSSIREAIGTVLFLDVLGAKRQGITNRITKSVNKEAQNFGVDIIDVRIVRLNLPDKARNAVYQRMRADREKEAREIRAKGSQESQVIKANADRQKTVIVAEARKKAEILKGEGDAEAIVIFANAYNKDRDFFKFYRSLDAYKNSMKNNSTKFVLSSNNEFMKYFNDTN